MKEARSLNSANFRNKVGDIAFDLGLVRTDYYDRPVINYDKLVFDVLVQIVEQAVLEDRDSSAHLILSQRASFPEDFAVMNFCAELVKTRKLQEAIEALGRPPKLKPKPKPIFRTQEDRSKITIDSIQELYRACAFIVDHTETEHKRKKKKCNS